MNYTLFRDIHGLAGNSVADGVMRFCAQDLLFVLAAALAVLCLREITRRGYLRVATVGVALAVAFLLGLAAAALHPELRPFQTHAVHVLVAHAGGQSFPSDHSTAAFAIAFATSAFLSRRWGLLLVGGAICVGFARVYAGIHYPADVVASAVVAALGIGAVAAVARTRLTPVLR